MSVERLTMYTSTKAQPLAVCKHVSTDNCLQYRDCYECPKGREILATLAAYEDTGMTPEQIVEMRDELERIYTALA